MEIFKGVLKDCDIGQNSFDKLSEARKRTGDNNNPKGGEPPIMGVMSVALCCTIPENCHACPLHSEVPALFRVIHPELDLSKSRREEEYKGKECNQGVNADIGGHEGVGRVRSVGGDGLSESLAKA